MLAVKAFVFNNIQA